MAIVKMKLINITADNEYLNEVLTRFIELDDFYPEPANKLVDSVHGSTTLYHENPYLKMLNRIRNIEADMGLEIEKKEVDVQQCDLEEISRFMETTHDKFDQIDSNMKEIKLLIQEDEDAMKQVENIKTLDISLDDLFSCRYTSSRVGRLPLDSEEKLKFYNSRPFIWNSFSKDNNYSWGIYITSQEDEREVDNIFTSLYFERLQIPDFVHGTPEQAEEDLKREIEKLEKDLNKLEESKTELRNRTIKRYSDFTAVLEHVSEIFEARKFAIGLGNRFSITGFMAIDDITELKKTFADLKEVEIEIRPASNDKRLTPPKKRKNGWFSKRSH